MVRYLQRSLGIACGARNPNHLTGKTVQMKMPTWCLVVIALLVTSQAGAGFISVNSSIYDDGTDVSQALPGATLSALWGHEGDFAYTPSGVTVNNGFFASDDTNAPHASGFSGMWGGLPLGMGEDLRYDSSIFRVDFDTPTNYVEIWGMGGSFSMMLEAFNSAGEMIGSCATHDHPMVYDYPVGRYDGCWTYYGLATSTPSRRALYSTSVLLPTADIAYVRASTGYAGIVNIDQVTYNRVTVPEPATLGMLGLGILGVIMGRRRKR
jgi:hypothetical protein